MKNVEYVEKTRKRSYYSVHSKSNIEKKYICILFSSKLNILELLESIMLKKEFENANGILLIIKFFILYD